MGIVITEAMENAFIDAAHQAHEQVTESVAAGLQAALEGLVPEAKRELAAQLLQAANEAEGHPAP